MWFCGRVLLECISSLLVRTFVPSFCVGTFVMLLLFFLSSRRISSSNARGRSCFGVVSVFTLLSSLKRLYHCLRCLFGVFVLRGGGPSSCLG